MKISTETFDKYIILKIDIGDDNVPNWLNNNKQILIPELLSTAEKIIYDDIKETVPVLKLIGDKISNFIKTGKDTKNIDPSIIIGLDFDDIDPMLGKSLIWAIEEEEYELCHRIKLLQERNQK